MIRVPRGAIILDATEVDYVVRAFESFGQLMAQRRDVNGNPIPSQPSPRLVAMTDKLRRAVDSLAIRDPAGDHGICAESPASTASVRAYERDGGHACPHDIGTAAAAHRLGITPNGVRDLVRRGRLVARRTGGGRWMVDAASVEAHAVRRGG